VSTWRRLARFNLVGAAGIGVHLVTVWLLTRSGMAAVAATAVAVLAALAHNFSWHRHWTWSDRPRAAWWRGFARFVAANGVVSFGGNVLITAVLTTWSAVGPVPANAIAIAACGLINYQLGDRVVFAGGGTAPDITPTSDPASAP